MLKTDADWICEGSDDEAITGFNTQWMSTLPSTRVEGSATAAELQEFAPEPKHGFLAKQRDPSFALCPSPATNDMMKRRSAVLFTSTPLSDDSSYSSRVEIWAAIAVKEERIAQS